MGQQHETEAGTQDRELISSRVIDTSAEKVFEAFRNPKLLARWWGPAGFTNTFQTFNFQPGGTWEFIMHGPDGTDYPNRCVFVEITAAKRIVFDHVVAPHFRMTIRIEKLAANQTRFGFHMLFESAEVYKHLKPMCIPANEQNFDRLEAVLAEHS